MKKLTNKEFFNIKSKFQGMSSFQILSISINNLFKNECTYVCSFGAESAILLHMISKIDKTLPILFLNTKKLFKETIKYKNDLISFFKLKNIVELQPDQQEIEMLDPEGKLWQKDVNKCCTLRKVKPLNLNLKNFTAWFSGRKAYHSNIRSKNEIIEIQEDKYIISPLLNLDRKSITNYLNDYDIPVHPLVNEGFFSIGCTHCTKKTENLGNIRSGRWNNLTKTECGIHK